MVYLIPSYPWLLNSKLFINKKIDWFKSFFSLLFSFACHMVFPDDLSILPLNFYFVKGFLKVFPLFLSFFKIFLLSLYTPLYVVVKQIYLHYFFASSLRLELVPSTSFLNVLTCTISSLVSVHFVLSIKLFCKNF